MDRGQNKTNFKSHNKENFEKLVAIHIIPGMAAMSLIIELGF
jgi:hypothetical protein